MFMGGRWLRNVALRHWFQISSPRDLGMLRINEIESKPHCLSPSTAPNFPGQPIWVEMIMRSKKQVKNPTYLKREQLWPRACWRAWQFTELCPIPGEHGGLLRKRVLRTQTSESKKPVFLALPPVAYCCLVHGIKQNSFKGRPQSSLVINRSDPASSTPAKMIFS